MQNSNKLYRKILGLLLDILMYAIKIGKQVSLPGKNGKGNVLSSLFYFFIGIIEKLNFFEHGLFRMTVFLRNKYVRRAVFITGFVLFLLSLFEWNTDQAFKEVTSGSKKEQLLSKTSFGQPILRQTEIKRSLLLRFTVIIHPESSIFFYKYVPNSQVTKKFILNRTLRL